MSIITSIFDTILYEPIFNLLLWVKHTLPGNDFGIAIIVTTIIIKIVLIAPSYSSIRSQASMQKIQPKIDQLRKKYKGDQQRMSQELMKVYREHKVNPLSSCLPMLIQLPILIALYRVFIGGIDIDPESGILVTGQLDHLYGWMRGVYADNPITLKLVGLIDLTKPNVIFAALAAGFQYWQSKMLVAKRPAAGSGGGAASSMTRNMVYIVPGITFFFGITFPAGLTLYWIVSTLFMVVQQYFFLRKKPEPEQDAETKGTA